MGLQKSKNKTPRRTQKEKNQSQKPSWRGKKPMTKVFKPTHSASQVNPSQSSSDSEMHEV
jgi:hypothetical protein